MEEEDDDPAWHVGKGNEEGGGGDDGDGDHEDWYEDEDYNPVDYNLNRLRNQEPVKIVIPHITVFFSFLFLKKCYKFDLFLPQDLGYPGGPEADHVLSGHVVPLHQVAGSHNGKDVRRRGRRRVSPEKTSKGSCLFVGRKRRAEDWPIRRERACLMKFEIQDLSFCSQLLYQGDV